MNTKNYVVKLFIIALCYLPMSFAQTGKYSLQTVSLSLPTMTCAVCPITVKKALEKVPGVSDVHVNFEERMVAVEYDPQKTTIKQLTEATAEAGYPSFEKLPT